MYLTVIISCYSHVYGQCSSGCTTTLNSTGGAGNITLEAGDTLCINATSANLNVNYAEVRMRPGSGLKMCSDPEDTIKFNAELIFYSGGVGTHSLITNNGNFDYTFGNLGYQRTNIVNNGYWEVQGDFNQNSTGPPTFINNSDAEVIVNGDFNLNAGTFQNDSEITITGDMDFNGADFINTSTLEVGGLLTINSSTNITVTDGVFIADDLILNSGNFEAGAGGCAAFLITNNTTINGGVNVNSGDIWLTDSTNTDTVNSNGCPGPDEDCGGFVFSSNNTCFTTLPVLFKSFEALRKNSWAEVSWQTAIEVNSDYFLVEWTNDLRNWHVALSIQAAGNSSEIISYNARLVDAPMNLFYVRVRSVDLDGNIDYSKIRTVLKAQADHTEVSLFTTQDDLRCTWEGEEETLKMELVNLQGQLLYSNRILKNDIIPLQDVTNQYVIAKVYGQSGTADVKLFQLGERKNCYHTQLRVR